MIWQDWVASLASVIFIYAMIPQILYGHKTRQGLISIQFAVFNIIAMTGLVVVYASFGLLLAAILNSALILCWIALLGQRLKYGPVK
jgi:hypothetical protein